MVAQVGNQVLDTVALENDKLQCFLSSMLNPKQQCIFFSGVGRLFPLALPYFMTEFWNVQLWPDKVALVFLMPGSIFKGADRLPTGLSLPHEDLFFCFLISGVTLHS